MRRVALVILGVLPVGVAAMAASEAAPPAPLARTPRVNYALHCQGCHLPDGSGSPGQVPTMRGHLTRYLEVPGGREYIVRVPGVSTSKLSDADTAALMNWLVHEMGPRVPDNFQPYTTAEISALRSRWLNRPDLVRTKLIKAIDRLPPTN